jgi:hypothetical protein
MISQFLTMVTIGNYNLITKKKTFIIMNWSRKMEIRRAERKKAKLRLGIAAPSGAGKTYSALLLAFGLGGKIGLIDTEHGSGDLYAHLGEYDVISIEAPYTTQKYIQAITAFEQAGYSTVIIDSLTHAWAGDGGLLDKQGKMADRGTNSFAAWRTITPEHNALVDAMLKSPCHIIATMRSKQEYVLETNDKGKQQPKKVGLAPVQREGMEYEFTVMLDVDMNHIANASKDRTSLFDGQYFKITSDTGDLLKQWLETGTEQPVFDLKPMLKAITTAKDMDALRTHYTSAIKLSGEQYHNELTEAKDKRKIELTPMEKAA